MSKITPTEYHYLTELRVNAGDLGYVPLEGTMPRGFIAWTPATWGYTSSGERPIPLIIVLNPDGSVWVDWERLRLFMEAYPPTRESFQPEWSHFYLLHALKEGKVSEVPWSEVIPQPSKEWK